MKKTSIALLTIILVGFSLWIPSNDNIVSSQTRFTISGYVLDPNGNGIAGAKVNTQELFGPIPSYTNISGYYELTAYIGNNRVYITPPSNSNYVEFSQFFSVQSNITANFTLSLGYRLSGLVLDQNSNPVYRWAGTNNGIGLIGIYLDNYWSGWFVNSDGSFYVVAPPGNHTIFAKKLQPISVSTISYLGEFEVLNNTSLNLNDNIIGNIIINTQDPTPSPTSTPSSTNTASPTRTPSPANAITTTPYSSQTPTPTTSIPELPILVILPLFLSMFFIAIILKHRKTALFGEQI